MTLAPARKRAKQVRQARAGFIGLDESLDPIVAATSERLTGHGQRAWPEPGRTIGVHRNRLQAGGIRASRPVLPAGCFKPGLSAARMAQRHGKIPGVPSAMRRRADGVPGRWPELGCAPRPLGHSSSAPPGGSAPPARRASAGSRRAPLTETNGKDHEPKACLQPSPRMSVAMLSAIRVAASCTESRARWA